MLNIQLNKFVEIYNMYLIFKLKFSQVAFLFDMESLFEIEGWIKKKFS